MKELLRILAFSFGLALCSLMVISVGIVIFTGGNRALDPSGARMVFLSLFLFWLLSLGATRWWKTRKMENF